MSFPFETEETEEIEEIEPCEYGINFKTGQLTGEKVYGIEAIKVWVWMALHTPRYRHVIFSWDYGSEVEDLIGKGYTEEYLNTEVPRMIEECLLMNPNITEISDYDIVLEGDKLTCSFTINTTYGEVALSV